MSDYSNIPEAELLIKIARGDEKAFAELFHKHKDMVFNVAWSFTKDQTMSEDILQDVFVSVWKKRETLTEINEFSAWLFTITKNRSFTFLKKITNERKKGTEYSNYQTEFQPTEAGQLSADEVEDLLAKGLSLLTTQQRRVFELKRLDGYSVAEIAEKMGISKNTVSVHMNLALRTLRTFFLTHLDFATCLALFSALYKK